MDRECFAFGKPGHRPFCYYDEDNRPIEWCDHVKADRSKFYICKQRVANPRYKELSESQDSIDVPADILVGCCGDSKKICGRCNSLGLVCQICWEKFNEEYNLTIEVISENVVSSKRKRNAHEVVISNHHSAGSDSEDHDEGEDASDTSSEFPPQDTNNFNNSDGEDDIDTSTRHRGRKKSKVVETKAVYKFIKNPNLIITNRNNTSDNNNIIPSITYEKLIREADIYMSGIDKLQWHPNLWSVPLCGGHTVNGTPTCKHIPISVILYVKNLLYSSMSLVEYLKIFPTINTLCNCDKLLPLNCTMYCKLLEVGNKNGVYSVGRSKQKTENFKLIAGIFNTLQGLYFESFNGDIVSHTTVKRKIDDICSSFISTYGNERTANHDDHIALTPNSTTFHIVLHNLCSEKIKADDILQRDSEAAEGFSH